MTFDQVRAIVEGKPFWFSPMHDYTLSSDHISMLGIDEEVMVLLRSMISEDWAFVEKRRNPENGFLRIDIVKTK